LLDKQELESLKMILIKELIERKVFHKFRFMGKRYFISIDGTGVSTYNGTSSLKNHKITFKLNVIKLYSVFCLKKCG